jgi:hypothetical protein
MHSHVGLSVCEREHNGVCVHPPLRVRGFVCMRGCVAHARERTAAARTRPANGILWRDRRPALILNGWLVRFQQAAMFYCEN